jgi:hypothetical protein
MNGAFSMKGEIPNAFHFQKVWYSRFPFFPHERDKLRSRREGAETLRKSFAHFALLSASAASPALAGRNRRAGNFRSTPVHLIIS